MLVRLEKLINTVLENFFHLPTFMALAIAAFVLVWRIYDVGFDLGDGVLRLHTNRGNVNLIWINGCCDLDW